MKRHVIWVAAGALLISWLVGSPALRGQDHGKTAAEPAHTEGHKTAHGGCLNAIGTCEIGHAEVKVEDGKLRLWFVGGGSDTLKAIRVTDKEIALSVKIEGVSDAKAITLMPKPNALAEEQVGDCSRFEGTADWLKGAGKFVATGRVTFRGQLRELRIEFPAGYDPDDDAPKDKS